MVNNQWGVWNEREVYEDKENILKIPVYISIKMFFSCETLLSVLYPLLSLNHLIGTGEIRLERQMWIVNITSFLKLNIT